MALDHIITDPNRTVPDIAGRDLNEGWEWWDGQYHRAGDGRLGQVDTLSANPGPQPGVNPKDLIGDTKLPVHLVPPALMLEAAKAISLGAKKYGPYNWRDYPIQAHAYYAAILRHLSAWWDGETLDPESGENHLAHVAAGLAILLDAHAAGTLVDDRPNAGPSAAIIRGAA